MVRLFMQLIKKFGYQAARKMAPKFGIKPVDIKKAMSKGLNGGSGEMRRVSPDFNRKLYERLVNEGKMPISSVPGSIRRQHYSKFGNEAMRIPRNVPPPGVAETGRAQLDRISRAGRTQQTLPPQVGRGPYEGTPIPGRMGEGVPERLSRDARKFFDRRMASPGSVMQRQRPGSMYAEAPSNMAEMGRALEGLSPAQSRRILMALAKMGLIGAGGAGAARMFQDDEGMV